MKQLGKTYTLRFDTKRELDVIRKAAKSEKRSINSFIIREALFSADRVIKQIQQPQTQQQSA